MISNGDRGRGRQYKQGGRAGTQRMRGVEEWGWGEGSRAVREQKSEGQLVRVLSPSAVWGFSNRSPCDKSPGNSSELY